MNTGVVISVLVALSGLVIVLVVFAYAWRKRGQKAPPQVKPLPWDDD